MKTIYKNTKIISALLCFLFLSQSCHVYKRTPISLDEAASANRRVKLITTDNKKICLKKIEKVNDTTYYGYVPGEDKTKRVPLKKNNIQKIKVVNKTGSTIVTVLGITIPVFIIIALAAGSVAANDSYEF